MFNGCQLSIISWKFSAAFTEKCVNSITHTLCNVSLRTSVYEFLGTINLMSSATIFTSAIYCNFAVFIVIFFLPEQLGGYYCFSLALLITGSQFLCLVRSGDFCGHADSLRLPIFQWYSLSMVPQRAVLSLLSPYVVSHALVFLKPFLFPLLFRLPLLVFLKPHLKGAACFSFIFPSARDSVHSL